MKGFRRSGVSSATSWQAAQSTRTRSPARDPRSEPDRGLRSGDKVEAAEGDLEVTPEEEEEVLEDASELGEDEDDVAEVIEKVEEGDER